MLLTIEKIIFLNNVYLFKSMLAKDLHLVAYITKEEFYRAGDYVIREGDVGDKMFVIYSGEVEIFKGGFGDDRKVILDKKTTNDFFGEMSILDAEPRSATVLCLTDTQCLTISKDDLTELIYEYPDLSFSIFKGLVSNLREANARFFSSQRLLKEGKTEVTVEK